MLYMIFDTKMDKKLVKVGQAKNIGDRMSGYTTHNPLAEMRWKSRGTSTEEVKARMQIMNMGGKRAIARSEWLIVPDEVYYELYEKGFAMLKGFSGKNPRKI